MTISSIAFRPVPGTGDHVNFTSFYIDMGICTSNELDPVFQSNYAPGTKVSVFERTSTFTVTAVEPWTTIVLDTPFFYDPAQGNLVIELGWPDGDEEFYSFDFFTPGISMIKSGYGQGSGDPFYQCPNLLLEGEEAFEQTSFAAIKATFN